MADDPKKKKKVAAPSQASGSLAAAPSAPNPATELSDEEFRQQYMAQLKPEGDASGGTAQPEPESPVKSWWQRFNDVMSKTHSADEVGRGIVRGVVNAGIETVKTISEGAAALERHTGLGEAIAPGFNESYDRLGGARGVVNEFARPTQEKVNQVLGKRSDDGLAAFTESATQFISSFAALPGEGVIAGLAKGAVTDFSAFDPYEAQLAELAANTKVPGLQQLGALLSVHDNDSALEARFKRAAAGAIPGVVLEGLIAGARAVRAVKVLKSGATGAEKQAAEEALAAAQKTVQDVAEGTHAEPNAAVKVAPTDDGHFTIEHSNGTNPLEGVAGSHKLTFADEAEALQQAESINSAVASRESAGKVDFDPEDVQQALEKGTDPSFSVSSHNTVEQDVGFVQKLADFIKDRRDQLMAASEDFKLSVEDAKQLARETLAKIPKDQLDPAVKALLGNAETQDVAHVAARMVLGQKGRNIIKLHDIVEARPHDPVAMDELKQAIVNYYDLNRALNPGESAGARRLRFVQENDQLGKEGFDTAEQAQAKQAQVAAKKELDDAVAEVEQHINKTDTNAVTASDFSFARARQKIQAAYDKLEKGDTIFEHDPQAAIERANKIKEAADAQRADPLTISPEDAKAAQEVKTTTTNPIEELSKWLDRADQGLEHDLDKARGLIEKVKEDPRFKNSERPEVLKKAGGKEKFEPMPNTSPSGMKLRAVGQKELDDANAKTIARMFKLANGEPRDVDAIFRGTQVLQKGGTMRAALEVFTNSLLSGPPTWATVTLTGQALSHIEPFVKITAGVMGANKAMVREGIDTIFGLWAHLGDNLRVAAAAMREGRSIINPAPTTFAIGGLTGKVIRSPGNLMMGLDEFTRVSNYRAYIRAQSLRVGREQGLEGLALAKRVSDDLRAAFDPETGIATIPQALKYADLPTLSAPLKPGFGRALQEFTSNATAAKFVAPFVRATTNIWDYAWKAAPGLNLFNQEARAIMKAGGEEAAMLHARSLLATTVGLYAFTQAQQGNLTGKGPSDPDLRKAWLKDHQPYSVRVGDKWISYNRLDPVATPLGIMADLYVFGEEMGHEHHDFEQSLNATLGAVVANMGSKTYMRGIFDLADAWHKGDANSVGRYLQNFGSAFVAPNLLNKLNPDPYYREVDSMMDAVKARLPYFSEKLDARYDIFGEKVLKPDGWANRALNPMTVKDVSESKVEQELLTIGKSLAPAPEKLAGGMIDLHDKSYVEKDGQPSPYTRMMELIRNPGHGKPSLREAMEEAIKSPNWDKLSDGTDDFRGGRKLARLQGLKERYEANALRTVRREYPKLNKQLIAVLRARGAAMRGGEDAVEQSEQLTGPYRQ